KTPLKPKQTQSCRDVAFAKTGSKAPEEKIFCIFSEIFKKIVTTGISLDYTHRISELNGK
ncbi:MAG: hypothetical protein MUO22_02715, partial [Sedimentisphaerales bacterium]|nr:hypothetical protein [Sedimentisphaerales bacterium]